MASSVEIADIKDTPGTSIAHTQSNNSSIPVGEKLSSYKKYTSSANKTLTVFTMEMSEILRQSIERLDNISFKVRSCVYDIENQDYYKRASNTRSFVTPGIQNKEANSLQSTAMEVGTIEENNASAKANIQNFMQIHQKPLWNKTVSGGNTVSKIEPIVPVKKSASKTSSSGSAHLTSERKSMSEPVTPTVKVSPKVKTLRKRSVTNMSIDNPNYSNTRLPSLAAVRSRQLENAKAVAANQIKAAVATVAAPMTAVKKAAPKSTRSKQHWIVDKVKDKVKQKKSIAAMSRGMLSPRKQAPSNTSVPNEEAIIQKIKEHHRKLIQSQKKEATSQGSNNLSPLELLREKYTERPRKRKKRIVTSSEITMTPPKRSQTISECYANEKFRDALWFGPKLSNHSQTSTAKTKRLARKYANENLQKNGNREKQLPVVENHNLSGQKLKMASDSKQDWCIIMQTQKQQPKLELKQNSPFAPNNILDEVTLRDLEPIKSEYPRKDHLTEMSTDVRDTLLYKLVNHDNYRSLEYLVNVQTDLDKYAKYNYRKYKDQLHESMHNHSRFIDDIAEEDSIVSKTSANSKCSEKGDANVGDKENNAHIAKSKNVKKRLRKYIIDPSKSYKREYFVMPVLVQFDKDVIPHMRTTVTEDVHIAERDIPQAKQKGIFTTPPTVERILEPYIFHNHEVQQPNEQMVMTATLVTREHPHSPRKNIATRRLQHDARIPYGDKQHVVVQRMVNVVKTQENATANSKSPTTEPTNPQLVSFITSPENKQQVDVLYPSIVPKNFQTNSKLHKSKKKTEKSRADSGANVKNIQNAIENVEQKLKTAMNSDASTAHPGLINNIEKEFNNILYTIQDSLMLDTDSGSFTTTSSNSLKTDAKAVLPQAKPQSRPQSPVTDLSKIKISQKVTPHHLNPEQYKDAVQSHRELSNKVLKAIEKAEHEEKASNMRLKIIEERLNGLPKEHRINVDFLGSAEEKFTEVLPKIEKIRKTNVLKQVRDDENVPINSKGREVEGMDIERKFEKWKQNELGDRIEAMKCAQSELTYKPESNIMATSKSENTNRSVSPEMIPTSHISKQEKVSLNLKKHDSFSSIDDLTIAENVLSNTPHDCLEKLQTNQNQIENVNPFSQSKDKQEPLSNDPMKFDVNSETVGFQGRSQQQQRQCSFVKQNDTQTCSLSNGSFGTIGKSVEIIPQKYAYIHTKTNERYIVSQTIENPRTYKKYEFIPEQSDQHTFAGANFDNRKINKNELRPTCETTDVTSFSGNVLTKQNESPTQQMFDIYHESQNSSRMPNISPYDPNNPFGKQGGTKRQYRSNTRPTEVIEKVPRSSLNQHFENSNKQYDCGATFAKDESLTIPQTQLLNKNESVNRPKTPLKYENRKNNPNFNQYKSVKKRLDRSPSATPIKKVVHKKPITLSKQPYIRSSSKSPASRGLTTNSEPSRPNSAESGGIKKADESKPKVKTVIESTTIRKDNLKQRGNFSASIPANKSGLYQANTVESDTSTASMSSRASGSLLAMATKNMKPSQMIGIKQSRLAMLERKLGEEGRKLSREVNEIIREVKGVNMDIDRMRAMDAMKSQLNSRKVETPRNRSEKPVIEHNTLVEELKHDQNISPAQKKLNENGDNICNSVDDSKPIKVIKDYDSKFDINVNEQDKPTMPTYTTNLPQSSPKNNKNFLSEYYCTLHREGVIKHNVIVEHNAVYYGGPYCEIDWTDSELNVSKDSVSQPVTETEIGVNQCSMYRASAHQAKIDLPVIGATSQTDTVPSTASNNTVTSTGQEEEMGGDDPDRASGTIIGDIASLGYKKLLSYFYGLVFAAVFCGLHLKYNCDTYPYM